MKIVITGSLGHISKPLTQELLQQGHLVTVISSNPQKQQDIELLGALAAIGSVEDPAFLTKQFTGADGAYCMTPPKFSEPDQLVYYERIANAYATAIKQSGIKRVVYLSSYGADLPSGTGFITGSYKAEQILNALPGVALTHIRPTFFYYNLLGFIPMIKSAGFIGAVYGGEDKLAMVSPNDIATAIAEEITQLNNTVKVQYVNSDDKTCNEVATILGNAIGKPGLTWHVLPQEKVMESLLSHGMPKNAAENLIELGTAIHTGLLRSDFDKHKPTFGNTKLESFTKEFATVYNNETQQHHN